MRQQEQTRLQVLNSLLAGYAGYMTMDQAAMLLGLWTRHIRRILAACGKDWAAVLAHGNQGRKPANATPQTLSSNSKCRRYSSQLFTLVGLRGSLTGSCSAGMTDSLRRGNLLDEPLSSSVRIHSFTFEPSDSRP